MSISIVEVAGLISHYRIGKFVHEINIYGIYVQQTADYICTF